MPTSTSTKVHVAESPTRVFNRVMRRGVHGSQEVGLAVRTGAVPEELEGSLLRNGPGRLSNHGTDYDHLFDGDGFVQRVSFSGGRIRYRSRYVETEAYLAENAAGRPLFRSFGTNLPGGLLANAGRFAFKNAANTNLLWTGSDLLALWEGGAPHAIDPRTLECIGPWQTDGGALSDTTLIERMMGNGRPFSAHPKALPGEEFIHNFGLSPGLRQRLLLYRIGHDGTLTSTEIGLPRLTFMHDFAAIAGGTRVFFDVGVSFHLMDAFMGRIPPGASVRGTPSETIIRVFDRIDEQITVAAPPGYVFHIPNGYRDGNDLIVDACWLNAFPDADDFCALINDQTPAHTFLPTLTRHKINPTTGRHVAEPLSHHPIELSSINPQVRGHEHRYVWGVSDDPWQRDVSMVQHGLLKVDTRTGEETFRDFYPWMIGEPLFVPTEGAARGAFPTDLGSRAEDDGFLICMGFDPELERGLIVIVRADSMETIAVLETPEPAHLGFHGIWMAEPI